jgi:hypothetical protein
VPLTPYGPVMPNREGDVVGQAGSGFVQAYTNLLTSGIMDHIIERIQELKGMTIRTMLKCVPTALGLTLVHAYAI